MPADDWRRLHALADRLEQSMALDVAEAIALASALLGEPEIAAAIMAGVETVYAVAKIEQLAATIGAAVEPKVRAIFGQATEASADMLATSSERPNLRLLGSFNLTNPFAVSYAQARSAALVTAVDEQTRQSIRDLVTRGFSEGRTVQTTARAIRQVVGLNQRQATALVNYRNAQTGYFSQANFPRTDPAKLAERMEARVEAYRQKLIRQRATMIARSETIRAANNGQQLLWKEAQRQGYLSTGVRRFWIITAGACKFCAPIPAMNADGVGIDQPFDTPIGSIDNPGDPHPNCRCAQRIETMQSTGRIAA